jgi:hypothetical protein
VRDRLQRRPETADDPETIPHVAMISHPGIVTDLTVNATNATNATN